MSWVPLGTYRETFTMSRDLAVLQRKEEVLEFLAADTHVGGTDLDTHMGHLQKDQWWPLHRKSEEKLGEAAAGSSCHVAIENPWCQEWHLGPQHRGAVLKPAAAPGATSTAASLTPGIATHQSQAAFRSPDSWWLQIPGRAAASHAGG